MTAAEFVERLDNVRKTRTGYLALCPAHDDHHPSLVVGPGDDGRVLLHCRTGCRAEDVVTTLGLTLADLFTGTCPHPAITRSSTDPMLATLRLARRQVGGREDVRCLYLGADAIRAGERIQRAACHDDEATWELLAQATELVRLGEACMSS